MRISVWTRVRNFASDMSGAAMVEYGVALLVVTAIGIGVVEALGTQTNQTVATACQGINDGNAC